MKFVKQLGFTLLLFIPCALIAQNAPNILVVKGHAVIDSGLTVGLKNGLLVGYYSDNIGILSKDDLEFEGDCPNCGFLFGRPSIVATSDIVSSKSVIANSFVARSDSRIKKNISLSNNESDMETLAKIDVTNYQYIDTIFYGNFFRKGVIAQEVEKVFPEAVTKKPEFIPNIFKLSEKVNISGDTVAVELANSGEIRIGQIIRLITELGQQDVRVIQTNELGFVAINWHLGEAIKVFVYGIEVKDFHTVDYDKIFLLNVSATQELLKRMNEKEKQLASLEANYVALNHRLSELEKKWSQSQYKTTTDGVQQHNKVKSPVKENVIPFTGFSKLTAGGGKTIPSSGRH